MRKYAYIKAIETYLPEKVEVNEKLGDERFIQKLGIRQRHLASEEESTSDLAFKVAVKIFDKGIISREEIDFILLCTQHPDYQMPTTACQLQDRLQLSQSTGAMDYNLGCSGYVYGLSIAKGLIETNQAKNILLITSSIYSKYINVNDKSIRPLFGDGSTVSLISSIEAENPFLNGFIFGSDGSKFKNIYIPVGGSKNPPRENVEVFETDENGNQRSNYEVHMDGAAVTYFTLRVTPQIVNAVLSKTNLQREDIDYYIFHQANKFVMNHVQKKCGLDNLNFYNDIDDIGNTVSGTIPFGIKKVLQTKNPNELKRVMLAGFGVGLSWSGCIADLSLMVK